MTPVSSACSNHSLAIPNLYAPLISLFFPFSFPFFNKYIIHLQQLQQQQQPEARRPESAPTRSAVAGAEPHGGGGVAAPRSNPRAQRAVSAQAALSLRASASTSPQPSSLLIQVCLVFLLNFFFFISSS
jgi:hypothetical protein